MCLPARTIGVGVEQSCECRPILPTEKSWVINSIIPILFNHKVHKGHTGEKVNYCRDAVNRIEALARLPLYFSRLTVSEYAR